MISQQQITAAGISTSSRFVDGEVFPIKGSTGFRKVTLHRATSGAHAGQFYLTCNCAAGHFVWRGAEFNACKHMRRALVTKLAGFRLDDGHLVVAR
jgi:hypothetical protein